MTKINLTFHTNTVIMKNNQVNLKVGTNTGGISTCQETETAVHIRATMAMEMRQAGKKRE